MGVEDGTKPVETSRRLTPAEAKWHREWRGRRGGGRERRRRSPRWPKAPRGWRQAAFCRCSRYLVFSVFGSFLCSAAQNIPNRGAAVFFAARKVTGRRPTSILRAWRERWRRRLSLAPSACSLPSRSIARYFSLSAYRQLLVFGGTEHAEPGSGDVLAAGKISRGLEGADGGQHEPL